MRLRIEHTTAFSYESPISEAYTEMRLAPLNVAGQQRTYFRLRTEPEGEVLRFRDRYGNEVHYFDLLQPHQQVRVTALSEVLTEAEFRDEEQQLSLLEQHDYLAATGYTPQDEALRALAQSVASAAAPADCALALMNAVHQALQYEKGATTVKTTAAEALALGKGVCQDYAHVLLAAARCVGLPARYVSGYFFSPDAPEMASHAWVDIFAEGRGWLALDPTHNCPQGERHVRVSVGRDYGDVPPTRGVYKGKAKEKMEVQVSVVQV